MLDAHLEQIRNLFDGKMLEVGNGRKGRRGKFKPPFERTVSWTHIDIDRINHPDVQTDVQYLPFRKDEFDTIVCLEMLEYVDSPQTALNEIKRVLKCNGTLIVSTPFMHRMDTPHDYWRFTETGLRYLFHRCGFKVKKIKSQGHAIAVALNVLKYVIYAQEKKWLRRVMALFFIPTFSLLWKFDRPLSENNSLIASFSTGYLVVVQKRNDSL